MCIIKSYRKLQDKEIKAIIALPPVSLLPIYYSFKLTWLEPLYTVHDELTLASQS